MSAVPQIKSDDLYQLLREGRISEFNERIAAGEDCDLTDCDFRSLDLRGWDAGGLDLSGSYFRNADLRGVDLSDCALEGASFHDARVAGVLFPATLSADEIVMSVQLGTRVRQDCRRAAA
ncbi:MAG: pentapeptide repeat-containing protein [Candidatus Eisenbacteria bacterium]|uniref:Pentapeptide repeat-containing protein n=1 Tax=Eiseniibacteriota bacterium TaxID=2212470 RepID=A0A956SDB6_UNCEI|nr:pentapeptide repeat-containing protein [Candidatus Eisenbacteria bacterium]